MSRIIGASINLEKIDKSKIKAGKDGTGKYLDISIIVNDELDKYGHDTGITIGQTKEERTAKVPKVYLGNGKTVWQGESKKSSGTTQAGANSVLNEDKLPF